MKLFKKTMAVMLMLLLCHLGTVPILAQQATVPITPVFTVESGALQVSTPTSLIISVANGVSNSTQRVGQGDQVDRFIGGVEIGYGLEYFLVGVFVKEIPLQDFDAGSNGFFIQKHRA